MAENVPYSPVPAVQPNGAGLPEVGLDVPSEAFGTGLGRVLYRSGSQLEQEADQLFAEKVRFAEMQNETKVLDASSAFSRQADALEVDFSKLRGQQAVDAYPDYAKKLKETRDTIGQTLTSPQAKRGYSAKSQQIENTSLHTIGLYNASQHEAAADAANAGAISAAQSRFANHYGLADITPDITEIMGLSHVQAQRLGLPAEAEDALIQKNVGDAYAQVIGARIFTGHVDQAEEIFHDIAQKNIPGTDVPILSGDRLVRMGAEIKQQKEAAEIDKLQAVERARRAQEGIRREASNDWLKKIYGGQATAQGILADDRLDPFGSGGKEELIRILETHGATGGKLKDDDAVVMDIWRRIGLPDGDPRKITDDRQITPYIGKGVNEFATANNLRNEIQGQNTAQGEIVTQMKKNVINEAERALVKSNPFSGLMDPNDAAGRANLSQFSSWFLRQYYAEVANGKNPMDLLDANSKEYLGKYINNFKQTPQQAMQAQADALKRAQSGAPPLPLPPRPGGSLLPNSPLIRNERRAATAFPEGMIEPGELNPVEAGKNWSTFEVGVDGIHKTLILPTKPGDRPGDDKTGFLGDAVVRWQKDPKHQSYGVFESGGEKKAAAFMNAAQTPAPRPTRTPGETPEQFLRRTGQ